MSARIGLMLYTVRGDCARDFRGTLQAVAELGYEGVELYDLHGHEPARVREWLDEFELIPVARHASLAAITDALEPLAEELAVLGMGKLVLSWIEPPRTAGDATAAAATLRGAAMAAAQIGLELGFHNHDAEVIALEDGRTTLDHLLEGPVFLEIDLGWTWWAGVDPVEVLEWAAGRVPLVHVKDFAARGVRDFRPVGDGGIDFDRVVPAAVAAGAEWLLVEQDETEGPALAACARSIDALRRIAGVAA